MHRIVARISAVFAALALAGSLIGTCTAVVPNCDPAKQDCGCGQTGGPKENCVADR